MTVDDDGMVEPALTPFVYVHGTVTVCWIWIVVTGMLAAGAVVTGATTLPPTALVACVTPAAFEKLEAAAGVGTNVIVLGIAVIMAGLCGT